jgi:hypothetical protein
MRMLSRRMRARHSQTLLYLCGVLCCAVHEQFT